MQLGVRHVRRQSREASVARADSEDKTPAIQFDCIHFCRIGGKVCHGLEVFERDKLTVLTAYDQRTGLSMALPVEKRTLGVCVGEFAAVLGGAGLQEGLLAR